MHVEVEAEKGNGGVNQPAPSCRAVSKHFSRGPWWGPGTAPAGVLWSGDFGPQTDWLEKEENICADVGTSFPVQMRGNRCRCLCTAVSLAQVQRERTAGSAEGENWTCRLRTCSTTAAATCQGLSRRGGGSGRRKGTGWVDAEMAESLEASWFEEARIGQTRTRTRTWTWICRGLVVDAASRPRTSCLSEWMCLGEGGLDSTLSGREHGGSLAAEHSLACV